jgi:hypothetical protein
VASAIPDKKVESQGDPAIFALENISSQMNCLTKTKLRFTFYLVYCANSVVYGWQSHAVLASRPNDSIWADRRASALK